ncbi:CWF complex protein sap62 [Malassezia vespertilionis]|uniref:U1-type domain-containing protein n=1 Tax=Malassezia vespertilionis TaxID=2020962 RepID=A0A2N1JAD1_9BASI|nr:CWF complex protein sap62 [Malassezia vespertilionis]PKI83505.1 hypothetical protein MVES_002399 [Malassezia vespertilionis]WFD07181.1 CWF complex protein sap62 [Malassezia vespertilionis]
MDYQNRAGSKGAGIASDADEQANRRERLRKLAMETIDISKDPYVLRNHVGSIECRLCLTVHANEGSYLAHTQGKKHQTNLARRAAKDAQDSQSDDPNMLALPPATVAPKKSFVKIGRPGYKITKVREPFFDAGAGDDAGVERAGGRMGLIFEVSLPEIKEDVLPIHRFMSSYEQKQEPPNRAFQYLVIAAEPYETIAFKIQSREIDRADTLTLDGPRGPQQSIEPGTWSFWDSENKVYTVQVLFKR